MYWCAIQIDQSVLVKPGIRYESGVTKVSIENGCVRAMDILVDALTSRSCLPR